MLGKREISDLNAVDIMNYVWRDVGPSEGVSLTDKFSVDALVQLCHHENWKEFPEYFRDWVVDVVEDIVNDNNKNMEKEPLEMRHVYLVYKRQQDDMYTRTHYGYCGNVLFQPYNGTPAIHLTDDDVEVNGEFVNIHGIWYFRYNVQGETNYMNVLDRKFVHYYTEE